jgi:ribosome-binding factor A
MGAPSSERGAWWKTGRLCRQVAESLSLALAGCGEEALLEAAVREVVPLEGGAQLRVTVELASGADPAAVLAALSRAQGRLRCEVAASIRRKRVPGLVFRIAEPDLP